MAGWIQMPLGREVGLSPNYIVLHGVGTQLPVLQKGVLPPNFWPISVVAEWLDGSSCHLARS